MRKQLPLVGEMTGSLASQDIGISGYESGAKYVNCYFDQYKGMPFPSERFEFVKRPGIENVIVDALAPVLVGTDKTLRDGFRSHSGSGGVVLSWARVFGGVNQIQITYNNTVMAAPAGWANGLTIGQLCELDNAITGFEGAVTSGVDGGLITAAAFTRIVDANYLAGPLGGGASGTNMVYMDGYLFQGNWVNGRIYNSNLNTPATWTATGYITSSLYPGALIAIRRFRHYLVAFKEHSIEFFENQGNPTPGSPLGPVKQLARQIGAAHNAYIRQVSDGIIFVGRDIKGLLGVYKLVADTLELKKISDQYVDGLLQISGNLVNMFGTGGGPNLPQKAGCEVIPWKGHEFYNLPLQTSAGFSLVYDNIAGTWMIWSKDMAGTGTSYPFLCNAVIPTRSTSEIYLGYGDLEIAGDLPRRLSETVYKDYSSLTATSNSIYVRWVSPMLDFGTNRRKFQSSFEVIYKLGGSTGGAGTLSMYYYDADTVNPTTPRTATTNQGGVGRVIWRQLGSFRHRRFVLTTTSNAPLRLSSIEVDLQMSEADLD